MKAQKVCKSLKSGYCWDRIIRDFHILSYTSVLILNGLVLEQCIFFFAVISFVPLNIIGIPLGNVQVVVVQAKAEENELSCTVIKSITYRPAHPPTNPDSHSHTSSST